MNDAAQVQVYKYFFTIEILLALRGAMCQHTAYYYVCVLILLCVLTVKLLVYAATRLGRSIRGERGGGGFSY